MKTENTELQVQERSVDLLIEKALSGGADLDKLGKLLEIREKWERLEAEKAFNKAMSDFKANPPKIVKDKSVSFGAGKASYKHASLQNVCEEINKALSNYGLHASWRFQQNGQISVTCKISHSLGHFEETTLSAPADNSGSKNAIQAIGSTITYLERYTLLALTGLAAEDQDDDGSRAQTVETITEAQEVGLEEFITSLSINREKFLKFFKIESLSEMPKSRYQEALTMLKTKEGKK